MELAKLRVKEQRYEAALKAVDEALKLKPDDNLAAYRSALANLVEAAR
ncbi:MAG: hypothetical protein ACQKBY_01540 [Verrucomicrobiales bacterium]